MASSMKSSTGHVRNWESCMSVTEKLVWGQSYGMQNLLNYAGR